MLRLLHFSDVHVSVPPWRFPPLQMLNKRLLGAGNLLARRYRRFKGTEQKLAALGGFMRDAQVDVVLCTGDYTALGTRPELRAARAAVDPLTRAPLGFVTVPGNHDLYLPDAADGRFEDSFGDLLKTDWPEACVDGPWPAVRLFGDDVAVVAVNSARPNPEPWKSSGRLPDVQLEALGRVLADPRLQGRFIFVMTHYAPRRHDGTPDHKHHGLENAEALLGHCATMKRGALLHGHIHRRFHLVARGVEVFGAGSATDAGREGLWLFEVDGARVRALPGHWTGDSYALEPSAAVELGP